MIDFHSHLLPGIDDGSHDIAETEKLLHQEYQQKVQSVVATPHFYASRNSVEHFLTSRQNSYEKVKQAELEDIPKVFLGAEVYYFSGMSKAEMLSKLCIEGTNLILIELPFCQWKKEVYQDIKQIIEKQKLTVILAHVERYYGYQKNKEIWNKIFSLPVYAQINAGSFLKWQKRRFCIKFIKEGHNVLLGSDCHNTTSRIPNLEQGRKVLKEKLGEQVLSEIDNLGQSILPN